MDIYIVGGAVRDMLMGATPKDTDYCVVGSSPEEMLAKGFIQVGADFPVFLHPVTHDEYALARTERKSGKGYGGFVTETKAVTLEEDLSRRDLTINAMAMGKGFQLIDPYRGKKDLDEKVLRHVSEAFCEDPLRVLRVARFMARFGPTWRIADETQQLMGSMVKTGELDALTRERVWVEIEKGLKEPHPEVMLDVLASLGVFHRDAFSEYAGALRSNRTHLGQAVDAKEDVSVLFALAFPRKWTPAEIKDSRIPKPIREVSHCLAVGLDAGLANFNEMTPSQKVELLVSLDAIRQTVRMTHVIDALAYGHPGQVLSVLEALKAIKGIDNAVVVAGLSNPSEIQAKIAQARVDAVASDK